MAGKRGRPSSDEHEDLPEKVTARFTQLEKAALLKMCNEQGLTLSAFIRGKVFGKRLASKSDSLMLNELRRQGGLLKHLCYEGHLEPEQINPVLANILVALDAVITWTEAEKFKGEVRALGGILGKIYHDGTISEAQVKPVLLALSSTLKRFNTGR